MNRKQRRAIKKQVGAEAQEKMSNQIAQFGKMPELCGICQKEFDKNNKEMVVIDWLSEQLLLFLKNKSEPEYLTMLMFLAF